jgi:hypothetical protein
MYHVTLPSNRYMRSGEAEVNMLYNQWFEKHTTNSLLVFVPVPSKPMTAYEKHEDI